MELTSYIYAIGNTHQEGAILRVILHAHLCKKFMLKSIYIRINYMAWNTFHWLHWMDVWKIIELCGHDDVFWFLFFFFIFILNYAFSFLYIGLLSVSAEKKKLKYRMVELYSFCSKKHSVRVRVGYWSTCCTGRCRDFPTTTFHISQADL